MEKDIKTIKSLLAFIFAALCIYFMAELSSLLIPLALALFLAVLVQPVLAWFEKKHWPFGLSVLALSLSALLVFYVFGLIIGGTYNSLLAEKEELLAQINTKLDGILMWVNRISGIPIDLDTKGTTDLLSEIISADWIVKSTGNFASTLTNMVGSLSGVIMMTALYFIILLGGILRYEQYINYLKDGDDSNLLQGFEKVKSSIVTYMKIKFFVSACTGLSYALVCWLFGIKFSPFWGFLAFVLNFIPTFGSIIATIPPLLLSLIEFDSFGLIIVFVLILFSLQMFWGNVVEPRIAGASLSLNTIAILFGLVFWGYVWGITGMLLSVPLMVLTKAILEQFPEAKIIVRLMGHSKL